MSQVRGTIIASESLSQHSIISEPHCYFAFPSQKYVFPLILRLTVCLVVSNVPETVKGERLV